MGVSSGIPLRKRERGDSAKEGVIRAVRGRRAGKQWLWLLPALGLLWLAPRWWGLVTHPVQVPATPAAAAQEALPRLLTRVSAEPRSPDARLELVAAFTLVGDRLGAWQQLAIAERLGGPPSIVLPARAHTAEALGQLVDAVGAAERAWISSPNNLRRALELHRLRTLHGDFEAAYRVAHAILTRHPTDPSVLAAAGEASFNLARYPEAIRRLQAARAADPERPAVGVQLGLALVRADRGREAVAVLREVVQAASPPPQAWEFLGQAQLSVGATTQADASFARAEQLGAAGGGAAFGRALAALAQGRTREAEAALRRALTRDPEQTAAAVTLAQLLRSEGRQAEAAGVLADTALATYDTMEAIAQAREAARLEPHAARRWRALARVLQEADESPAALAALRRAAALAPHDAGVARQQVETALEGFSPQEALPACARYGALRPADTAETAWWRFRAYRQMQDGPRAAAALASAVRARPDEPLFLLWQGRTLLEAMPGPPQLVLAEGYLRRALERRPSDVETLVSLAEVCSRQQRWEEAGLLLRRALTVDAMAGPGPLWLQLAQVDRALGRRLEAEWDISRYRSIAATKAKLARARSEAAARPRDENRHIDWAQAALDAGQPAEALVAARAAVRLAPTDPEGYRALAVASQRLGRLEDRIVAMEAARRAPNVP